LIGKKNGIGILTKLGGDSSIIEYRMDIQVEQLQADLNTFDFN